MAAGKGIIAAAFVGLLLRLAFGLGYWVNQPLTRDEREYLSLARSLTAGRGLAFDDAILNGPVDPFGRAPGYPVFLALVGGGRSITETVPPAVTVAQAFVGAGGVLLVGWLAATLAGGRAGVAASLIAACHPPLVAVASRAFSEALFWPLGLAVAAIVTAASHARGARARWLSFFAGAAAGLSALVRPAFIIFIAVTGVWWLWRRWPDRVMALALGTVLVVAPWTVRNYERYGRLVVIASEGGVTFWTGNHPLAVGDGDLAANPDLKRASQALRADHPGLSEEQMEPIYYHEALAWIRAHPLDSLMLEARKAFYLVVPIGPSYQLHSRRYLLASTGSYLLLLGLAVVGWWKLGAARARVPGLWLLAVSALVTSLVFFPQERFRIPVIDPVLIVCAGAVWMTGRDASTA